MAANISGDGTELDLDDGPAGGGGVAAAAAAAGVITGGGGGMVPTAGEDMTGGTMGTTVVGAPPMAAGLTGCCWGTVGWWGMSSMGIRCR